MSATALDSQGRERRKLVLAVSVGAALEWFDFTLFAIFALQIAVAFFPASIRERWCCATPWSWREKHVRWFFDHYLRPLAPATVYYYQLTAALVRLRRKVSLS